MSDPDYLLEQLRRARGEGGGARPSAPATYERSPLGSQRDAPPERSVEVNPRPEGVPLRGSDPLQDAEETESRRAAESPLDRLRGRRRPPGIDERFRGSRRAAEPSAPTVEERAAAGSGPPRGSPNAPILPRTSSPEANPRAEPGEINPRSAPTAPTAGPARPEERSTPSGSQDAGVPTPASPPGAPRFPSSAERAGPGIQDASGAPGVTGPRGVGQRERPGENASRREQGGAAAVVRVTIGAIEVHAVTGAAPGPQRPGDPRGQRAKSLEKYLEEREEE